ncbi:MAG: pilus assembly protein CpaA [Lachnospiraceae bacterium]|jgi:leader peptidase (prepilin peptidase)/N-methyltransferase|nr:pilus assembly protein CpaA [Lachnospiraceae bacterium]
MRKGLFLAFLLVSAMQDLHCKKVKVWVFALFGILALGINGYLWIVLGSDFMWKSHVQSVCLGVALLLFGRICEGSIGMGDGYFFVVSGLMMSFWENFFMLCMGIILCGIYGLALFTWNWIHKGTNIGKITVPFLPFAAIPGILLTIAQGTGI